MRKAAVSMLGLVMMLGLLVGDTSPALARTIAEPRGNYTINCRIFGVNVQSVGYHRDYISGKLRVTNSSYRYTYDAGARVHVWSSLQIRYNTYHGVISPRHYRIFNWHFYINVTSPNALVHWKWKACGGGY